MFKSLRVCAFLVCAVVLSPSGPASAFEVAPDKLAAAKKEGTVVWYSSLVGVSDTIAKMFEQQTGISVQLYNAVTGNVISKIETEKKAGMGLADVVHHTSLYDAMRWEKEGMLAHIPVAEPGMFAKGELDSANAWFGLRNLTSGIAYNKDRIPAAEVPHTWKDVLNPKFKGKIVYMSPSLDGMPQYTVKMLLDIYGWDYFRKLAALNPHMVQSDGNAITFVISGEEPIAGTIAAYNALLASYKGAPVGIVFPPEGVPVAVAPAMVMKNAPHPAAAEVFYQFLASKDVGDVMSKSGLLSGRIDVAPPKGQPKLTEMKPYFADLDWLAKNKKTMADQFDDIMAR